MGRGFGTTPALGLRAWEMGRHSSQTNLRREKEPCRATVGCGNCDPPWRRTETDARAGDKARFGPTGCFRVRASAVPSPAGRIGYNGPALPTYEMPSSSRQRLFRTGGTSSGSSPSVFGPVDIRRGRWQFAVNEVTRILSAIDQGDPRAAEQLLPLVYDELRQLAAHRLAQEKPGQTLQATALVHEVYLRLVGGDPGQLWQNRGHFFAAAAEAMRRILVERARHKKTLKAGGPCQRLDLDTVATVADESNDGLLALHEALEKLAKKDKRKADLVQLRFFAGLTNEQAAQALGISTSTADNDWAYARSWLRLEMRGDAPGQAPERQHGQAPGQAP